MHPSAHRLYAALGSQLGEHKQADLARLLDETPQQIHVWTVRGVSERGALKVQERFGINATWILRGHGPQLIAIGMPSPAVAPVGVERVRDALRLASVATSEELQAVVGLSGDAIAAAMVTLLKRGEVLSCAGPETRWVVPRAVADVTTTGTIPVFQVDAAGKVREFGTLIPTTHGRYWMEELAGTNRLHDGLPWFLQDMRPQGFLGRAFALANAELQLPPRPQLWTDDHVLRAVALAGEDLPGNLLVGSHSFDRYMRRGEPARVSAAAYGELAAAAMQGSAPGSSAGGEQPKFTCVRPDGVHVLVKFSPPRDSAVGQRWADLLVCEHLALRQLAAEGIPAARSALHHGGDRTFLEVERFDRTARGRIGMVSLQAYDSEYIGQMDNWASTAERMRRQNLLSEADARRLRFLEVFGRAIANSDRHYGNVSLLISPEDGEWTLAPAYDQLPMHYAPLAGELVEREFAGDLVPIPEALSVWDDAIAAGLRFWGQVAGHEAVSRPFRAIAQTVHIPRLSGLVAKPAAGERQTARAPSLSTARRRARPKKS